MGTERGSPGTFRRAFATGCAALVLGSTAVLLLWSAWDTVHARRQSTGVVRELEAVYEAGLVDGSISLERFERMRNDRVVGRAVSDAWLPRLEGIHLEQYGLDVTRDRAELRYRGTSRAGGYCFDVSFGDQPVVSVHVVERC